VLPLEHFPAKWKPVCREKMLSLLENDAAMAPAAGTTRRAIF
jgi:hypothetical protein